MEFCNTFNERTKDKVGTVIPVVITVYADRSFSFITKTPPASVLLKQAAGLASGSKEPGKQTAGRVTRAQIKEIAETKMEDLNAGSLDAAMKIIAGTARSIGLEVV
jgi:large subunit ribosomal protein L11